MRQEPLGQGGGRRSGALPLLKLDPSNLYNKYIGESEANFKRAMKAAERMAPVVLWIDELEKAFASGGSEDGGVLASASWGASSPGCRTARGDVFVVATANDIQRLPPEFLRKGRFDEIFFVDLPDEETRAEVFRIHLREPGARPRGASTSPRWPPPPRASAARRSSRWW